MAAAKKITVVLGSPQQKKSVVRFDSAEEDAALRSVYVDKRALKELGDPSSISITIEAA